MLLTTPEDLEATRWFAMRSYKRELQAEQHLTLSGIPHYIPKQYSVVERAGRRLRMLRPVIPNLIFVRHSQKGIVDFKRTYNDLQFMMMSTPQGPDYLVVRDKAMDDFMRVAEHYHNDLRYLAPDEINLTPGSRVRVIGGPFNGIEGYFIRVKGIRQRRVVVMLDGLMAIPAEVEPDFIEAL